MDWYLGIYILAILAGFAVYLRTTPKVVPPVQSKPASPQYTYNEVLAVIHFMVEEEYEKEKLLMEIKNNFFINDIQEKSVEMAQAVATGLSEDFWHQTRRFHPDEYTIQYIGRVALKYLYNHTVENRPSIT